MKILFLFLFSLSSFQVFADDGISKDIVLSMMEQMAKEGIIPASEVPGVRAKIQAMTPEQFGQIKGVARSIAAKNPSMNQKAEPTLQNAAASIDVDSTEFKDATKELDKILH